MDFDNTPKQDLQYASESISQSIAMGLDNIKGFIGRLREVMPEIISGFKGVDKLSGLPSMLPLNHDQKAFVKLITAHSYLETREIKAFVPGGMNTTYLSALSELDLAAEKCTQVQARVLQPYVVFLAHLSASGDILKSMDDHTSFNAQLEGSREAIYDSVNALFSNGKESRVKLGTCIERNADWELVLNNINGVVEKMRSIKRDHLDQLCKQAEDYLDIICNKLQKGELDDANPEVCKALADGAYQVACELEFVSVTYFYILALKGSIENTMGEIERVLSR